MFLEQEMPNFHDLDACKSEYLARGGHMPCQVPNKVSSFPKEKINLQQLPEHTWALLCMYLASIHLEETEASWTELFFIFFLPCADNGTQGLIPKARQAFYH